MLLDSPLFFPKAHFKNHTNRFKLPPVPKEKDRLHQKKKLQAPKTTVPQELISSSPSPDDVWSPRYFPTPNVSFLEAIGRHREYADPEMTDNPDGVVFVEVDLNLTTSKKTKFVAPPSGLVLLPHNFDDFFPNRVVAVVKSDEDQEKAQRAGAIFIGGQDLVKKMERGEIKAEDFDHVVLSDDMAAEAAVLKRLLKEHFPSRKNGNLGSDVDYMVRLFRVGKEFEATRESEQKGSTLFAFAKLSMQNEQLLENLSTFLHTLASFKPAGRLIEGLRLTVPPSKESFEVLDASILPVARKGRPKREEEELEEARAANE